MWRIPGGDRAFTEAEWAVFRAGLDRLVEDLEELSDLAGEAGETDTGAAAFDRLTPGRHLAVLADAAGALRGPAAPAPPRTAAAEGSVAAVLNTLHDLVAAELGAAARGGGRPAALRPLRRAVAAEFDGGEGEPPVPARASRRGWHGVLEGFRGRVLRD